MGLFTSFIKRAVTLLSELGNPGGAAGDILYWDGSNWVRLAIGAADQVLEVNAGATAPAWTALSSATFANLYAVLRADTVVSDLRLREFFSGAALSEKWVETAVAGAGSGAMVNEVNEGYQITTGANANDQRNISTNDINQFAHDGSVVIQVVKRVTDLSNIIAGLCSDKDLSIIASNTNQHAAYDDIASLSFKRLGTSDGTTRSATNTDVAVDTAFTLIRIVLDGTDAKLYINGTLKVTKTTNLPTVALQPVVTMITVTTAARTGRVREIEAYNT